MPVTNGPPGRKPAPEVLVNPTTGKAGMNPVTTQPPLPWYASKLTWVGIFSFFAGLIGLFGASVPQEEVARLAENVAVAAPALMAIIGVLIPVLRRMTNRPIKNSAADPTRKSA
jgi:hypothetical protein